MYVLAWTIGTGGSDPEGHEDHYEMFEDCNRAYERVAVIKRTGRLSLSRGGFLLSRRDRLTPAGPRAGGICSG